MVAASAISLMGQGCSSNCRKLIGTQRAVTFVLYVRVIRVIRVVRVAKLLGPGGGGGLDGNSWQAGPPQQWGVHFCTTWCHGEGGGQCWMFPAVGTCQGLGNGD